MAGTDDAQAGSAGRTPPASAPPARSSSGGGRARRHAPAPPPTAPPRRRCRRRRRRLPLGAGGPGARGDGSRAREAGGLSSGDSLPWASDANEDLSDGGRFARGGVDRGRSSPPRRCWAGARAAADAGSGSGYETPAGARSPPSPTEPKWRTERPRHEIISDPDSAPSSPTPGASKPCRGSIRRPLPPPPAAAVVKVCGPRRTAGDGTDLRISGLEIIGGDGYVPGGEEDDEADQGSRSRRMVRPSSHPGRGRGGTPFAEAKRANRHPGSAPGPCGIRCANRLPLAVPSGGARPLRGPPSTIKRGTAAAGIGAGDGVGGHADLASAKKRKAEEAQSPDGPSGAAASGTAAARPGAAAANRDPSGGRRAAARKENRGNGRGAAELLARKRRRLLRRGARDENVEGSSVPPGENAKRRRREGDAGGEQFAVCEAHVRAR
ncbi:MAG: hypothetical protein BJ554DRAFT_3055 [Olpidium bornovanus]|uniref:Uncharacterized protein n=1 Tax=Olpidium bornovanus TaxID=278681 RepID=A0A8H8DG76_9FUNG|nr:MAG: hypothetical protein BJ554DRAFT_3055 [Olpidium bornovanus]